MKFMMEKGEELFAIYYPIATSLEKQPIKAEVIAYFRFKDNQLLNIHGQVKMLTGAPSSVDM